MVKRLFVVFIFIFGIGFSAFSNGQKSQNNDSLWYFYPFTIDVSAGLMTPVGELAHYFRPSAQFGAGLGLMVSKKMRFQLWLKPRFYNQKNFLFIKAGDSIHSYKKNSVGASIGGWLSYTFYQNRLVSSEIISGLTWEDIPTSVLNPIKNDSISISGLGFSVGLNSWITTFPKLNFGVRAFYTYTTFNRSKYLAQPIGNHSFTFSIVYRWPSRKQINRKYYEW